MFPKTSSLKLDSVQRLYGYVSLFVPRRKKNSAKHHRSFRKLTVTCLDPRSRSLEIRSPYEWLLCQQKLDSNAFVFSNVVLSVQNSSSATSTRLTQGTHFQLSGAS